MHIDMRDGRVITCGPHADLAPGERGRSDHHKSSEAIADVDHDGSLRRDVAVLFALSGHHEGLW